MGWVFECWRQIVTKFMCFAAAAASWPLIRHQCHALCVSAVMHYRSPLLLVTSLFYSFPIESDGSNSCHDIIFWFSNCESISYVRSWRCSAVLPSSLVGHSPAQTAEACIAFIHRNTTAEASERLSPASCTAGSPDALALAALQCCFLFTFASAAFAMSWTTRRGRKVYAPYKSAFLVPPCRVYMSFFYAFCTSNTKWDI